MQSNGDNTWGACPACGAQGPVYEVCSTSRCRRFDYYRIPSQYAARRSSSPQQIDAVIGQLWGDYLLVDVLGAGAMGSVCLALQLPLGMKVAVKILGTEAGPPSADNRERFDSEVVALAKLTHPNIVRLHTYGLYRDQPYFVMEHVDGGRTLNRDLRRGMSREQALHILRQLTNALGAAHNLSIIHRDIKPSNVMLQSIEGDECFVRVVDFGLAKFIDEGDSTRRLAGTAPYMAPEQFACRNLGPWTDLYAVAALGFSMITGKRLYSGKSAAEIYTLKQQPDYDPTAPLSSYGVPSSVQTFFKRALTHNEQLRWQSAAEFRPALEQTFDELEIWWAHKTDRGPPMVGQPMVKRPARAVTDPASRPSDRPVPIRVSSLPSKHKPQRPEPLSHTPAPKASKPVSVVPEAVVPEAVVPEAVVPDAVVPDAVVPDAVVPEAVVPEAVVPDAAVPDAAVPSGNDSATQAEPTIHPDTDSPDPTPARWRRWAPMVGAVIIATFLAGYFAANRVPNSPPIPPATARPDARPAHPIAHSAHPDAAAAPAKPPPPTAAPATTPDKPLPPTAAPATTPDKPTPPTAAPATTPDKPLPPAAIPAAIPRRSAAVPKASSAKTAPRVKHRPSAPRRPMPGKTDAGSGYL